MSDLVQYLLTIIAMGLLAGILAFLLFTFSKFFAVKKDERVAEVEELLPGANCGACGFPGCSGYASAIINANAPIDKCPPGGSELITALSTYLGVEADANVEVLKAYVACAGSKDKAKNKFEYRGMQDCSAIQALYQGDKECPFGCLAGGSCIAVCPTDAIYYDKDGCVVVDQAKCISCEKCVAICPRNVIKMIPESPKFTVACNSTDKGGVVRKYCTVGCIACKICERVSTDNGFTIDNFLAQVNYENILEDNIAHTKCPTKCIIKKD